MKQPCILIVGHGEHGKDTLADAIEQKYGYKFRGSSQVAAAEIIYPMMSNFYDSPEDAFNNRRENRELWAACIRDYNRHDPAKLSKLVCEGGHGYTGLRDIREVKECVKQGVFTHIIWVVRDDIPENDPTLTFTYDDLKAMIYKQQLVSLSGPKLRKIINTGPGYLHDFVNRGMLDEFLQL